ncbi:MAG: helix-turn-helix transcriptional regulator [Betaproteobacteria bacterium]|nr:helix-turn-helix transcriptional regulator [Betaproteobacteria bacterium]
MSELRVLCYLRTHRRVWGLTQRELARLLGLVCGAQVSRIENSKRAPALRVALACQTLFGIPPCDMFPHVHAEVEEQVIRDVYELHEGLAQATTPAELRKRELYALALGRAVNRPEGFDEV